MENVVTTSAERGQFEAPGELLVQELLWIHNVLRGDLKIVQQLAFDVLNGAPPEQIRENIRALQTNSPLWKLRVNCLYYCRFVHSHHHHEDWSLFPALRRSDPALNPVVDKLEADHRQISDYLDEVEAGAGRLATKDTVDGRQHLTNALHTLADHLLEHLAYEEKSISPTLRSWRGWP